MSVFSHASMQGPGHAHNGGIVSTEECDKAKVDEQTMTMLLDFPALLQLPTGEVLHMSHVTQMEVLGSLIDNVANPRESVDYQLCRAEKVFRKHQTALSSRALALENSCLMYGLKLTILKDPTGNSASMYCPHGCSVTSTHNALLEKKGAGEVGVLKTLV